MSIVADDPHLKELLAAQLNAMRVEFDLKIAATHEQIKLRDKALELQAVANSIHFEQLNNEAERILKAAETTVSKDTWEAFSRSFQEWKGSVDRSVQSLMPRSEFYTYKEVTDKERAAALGRAKGITSTWGYLFSGGAFVIAVITAVIMWMQR